MTPWIAPAKINLFLHVVGRREDGYHLLQTVFRFLDYGDTLYFKLRDDGQVIASNPLPGVPPETDLTVRAARLLQQTAGVSKGVEITLDKRLPMGGGLGGGSSDAATTLIALNRLWEAGLSDEALQTLGLQLGADVPIFVYGQTAFAEGIGEAFTPVSVPPAWYVVLVPPVGVPTPAIFKSPDLRRDTPEIAPGAWRAGMGGNDLEPVACNLFPEVATYLELLSGVSPSPARMSGSGACVFAEFPDESSAKRAMARLPEGVAGFVAQGIDRHPLKGT